MSAMYEDHDLVYIDPEQRKVIGKVEWNAAGLPQSLVWPEEEGWRKRRQKQRAYPWGTYRSARRLLRLKDGREEPGASLPLDTALKRAAEEPFWD